MAPDVRQVLPRHRLRRRLPISAACLTLLLVCLGSQSISRRSCFSFLPFGSKRVPNLIPRRFSQEGQEGDVATKPWIERDDILSAREEIMPLLEQKKTVVPMLWEVFYENEEAADRAAETLDGAAFFGKEVRVMRPSEELLDEMPTKVNVQGIRHSAPLEEVNAFLSTAGRIQDVRLTKDNFFGQVRFQDADIAWEAMVKLDGSNLYGRILRAELDCSNDYLDQVLIHGLDREVTEQDLKDHVASVADPLKIRQFHIRGGKTAAVHFAGAAQALAAREAGHLYELKDHPGHKVKVLWPHDVNHYNRKNYNDIAEVRVSLLQEHITPEDIARSFKRFGDVEKVEFIEELPFEFFETGHSS
eukprot:TRINITY_DN91672_c0_g1_i1.p1 TRINITY_DN91672_c0_g1~~TRINITY_DN91672_c0_g1_i1.p1  ORF type:complete len:359 (-),score=74.13 TRINITY_DN91672_c0_g1_i1:20-1096(-)